jgi:uncharacterized protein YecE (DUF72 family)
MLYLGCPMWGLKSWVGNFFPKGAKQREFLALYSRRLNTVEGNTTFYALPEAAVVERWRDETPPGFKFCLKFPQIISHRRRLNNAEAETHDFLDRLARLGDRCGPAFLQLPPSMGGAYLPALAAYLAALPRDFRYAVEPRHGDFFGKDEAAFDDLLRRYAIGLTEWAGHVADWLSAGDDVFFFLHNPDDTRSPEEARLFHALVGERAPVPPLPDWGAAAPQQASLL